MAQARAQTKPRRCTCSKFSMPMVFEHQKGGYIVVCTMCQKTGAKGATATLAIHIWNGTDVDEEEKEEC